MTQLHKQQESIDFDSHFVTFTTDHTVFGRVPSRIEFMAAEVLSGLGEEEAIKATAKVERLMDHGVLWADLHSTDTPTGETASINKITAWPISEEVFEEARRVVWNIELMDGPHMQEVLDAHEAWTANEISRRVTE